MGWLDDLKKKRKAKYNPKKRYDSGDSEKYKGKSMREIMKAQDKDEKNDYKDGGMAYERKGGYSDGGMARKQKDKHKNAKKGALMILIGMGKPKK